jgi:hypothetical protein
VTKVNCSTSFVLANAIPEDHLVRKIDAALDLSWLRGELALLWQIIAIDRRNWIPESDFQ